jgi:hypothetical protein
MGLRSRIRSRLRTLFERFSGDYSAASDRLGDGTTAPTPDPGTARDRPVRARLVKPRSKPGEDPGEGR